MNNSEKFRGKFRTTSHRLKGFDYSSAGAYFITICTKNREHFFGEIVNDEMVLNDLGQIAKTEWENTGKIRENIIIDEFVIMPNHLHGILWIKNDEKNIFSCRDDVLCRDAINRVSTGGITKNKNPMRNPKSLGYIVRNLKARTSHKLRQINLNFSWQPNYYDRIIRDEEELNKTREYIIYNPQNWQKDDLYLENPAKKL